MKRILFALAFLWAVPVLAQTTVDGITFPSAHPRIYWTSSRLTAAQSWVTSTSYTALTTNTRPLDAYDNAFACLVMSNATACSTAITYATGANDLACSTTTGCDDMRTQGEVYMLIYDWAYSSWTSGQKSTFWGNWNTWNTNMHGVGWGNTTTPGPSSNYFCGAIRRDLTFGIATYTDNASASSYIDYAMNTDWPALLNFASPSGTGTFGTHGYALHSQEGGGEYGRYCQNYFALINSATSQMGRDLWIDSSTTAFTGDIYEIIYNTMPSVTTSRGLWDMFTWSDDENWVSGNSCGFISHNSTGNTNTTGGCGAESQLYGDFMQGAATEFGSQFAGKVARTWLSTVKPAIGPIFASIDPGGTSLAFSNLPLDYFASGPLYAYAKDNWTSNGMTLLLQMGYTWGSGHAHWDTGTFQAFRKGVPIIRETMDYSSLVAGYNSVGTITTQSGLAHNVPVIGGIAGAMDCVDNPGTMRRLEEQATYFYLDADISGTYTNNICDSGHPERENPYATHVEREVIFYRDIPAMLLVDRLGTDVSTRTTTFLSHCEVAWTFNDSNHYTCADGTQVAYYTVLNPSTAAPVSVTESANSSGCANCQFRLEANNTNPGATTNYFIVVVQFRDSAGSNLTPSIVDNGTSWTVTLDGSHSATIIKGLTSSGGSVTISGTTTNLRTTVEPMTESATGIVWGSGAPPAPGAAIFAAYPLPTAPVVIPVISSVVPTGSYVTAKGCSQDGVVWNISCPVRLLCTGCTVTTSVTFDGTVIPSTFVTGEMDVKIPITMLPVPTVKASHVFSLSNPVIAIPTIQ
jgi:hypothetical protein